MVTKWRNGLVCHLNLLQNTILYHSTKMCVFQKDVTTVHPTMCTSERQRDVRYALCSNGVSHTHTYSSWDITRGESNEVLSADLAEWHQEAKPH